MGCSCRRRRERRRRRGAGRRRRRQGEGRRQGGLVHLDADRAGPEDRRRVPEGDRHQGRDVPLRRLGDPAALPAGDGRRPGRRRRADPFRAGRRQCARQEGLLRRLQAEEFRQGARGRQGSEWSVRRPAAQHDDALSAQRQSRGRRRAQDLGRPARSQIQGQAGHDRSVLHLAAGVGGRHHGEGARLAVLREAARKRRHDRAGQSAGRRICSSAASG